MNEDSKEGIRGARRAGMKCLAATNSHPPELLSEATAVVKSLNDIKLNFLQNMCAEDHRISSKLIDDEAAACITTMCDCKAWPSSLIMAPHHGPHH